MQPDDVWDALVGDGYGAALRIALQTLMLVPLEKLSEAVDRVNRETAIGPLTNPSAYLDGRRWKNAEDYAAILRATLTLRRLLPEGDGR